MARLSFRCDGELVDAVDAARGDVARERWLRQLVQREVAWPIPAEEARAVIHDAIAKHEDTQDLAAVGREINAGLAEAYRQRVDSAQSKRDVKPIPKGTQ
jgi:1,6-anhydro-N-acetylmuramate kinase